jgi:DNA-binding PadR family transcriptional regulator
MSWSPFGAAGSAGILAERGGERRRDVLLAPGCVTIDPDESAPPREARVTPRRDRPLQPGEWAVLGVLCERPAHGFGVARRLTSDTPLGSVWTMNRPAVYRALRDLSQAGLVEPAGTSQSERGPARELFAATAAGAARLEDWLCEPVPRVRDVRNELLIKLALRFERGLALDELLTRQRAVLAARVDELERGFAEAEGFAAIVLRYRVETTRAALAFAEQLLGAYV